jgi:hypothetical protein
MLVSLVPHGLHNEASKTWHVFAFCEIPSHSVTAKSSMYNKRNRNEAHIHRKGLQQVVVSRTGTLVLPSKLKNILHNFESNPTIDAYT